MWQGFTGQEELGKNVCAESPLQLRAGDQAQRLLRKLDSGIVDDDVETTKFGDRLCNHITAELLIADVARQEQTTPTGGLDEVLRFLGILVLIQVHDRNIGTFLGKHHRDRAPNPAVATRDDGHLVAQLTGWLVISSLRLGPRRHQVLPAGLFLLLLWRQFLGFGLTFFHRDLPQVIAKN
jgi:hypothetical protein